jgi:hypothetical protein
MWYFQFCVLQGSCLINRAGGSYEWGDATPRLSRESDSNHRYDSGLVMIGQVSARPHGETGDDDSTWNEDTWMMIWSCDMMTRAYDGWYI